MKKNMGTTDRTLRILIAAVLIGLYFGNVVTGTIGLLALALAGIFLLTSFIAFCPLYLPFRISTRKKSSE